MPRPTWDNTTHSGSAKDLFFYRPRFLSLACTNVLISSNKTSNTSRIENPARLTAPAMTTIRYA